MQQDIEEKIAKKVKRIKVMLIILGILLVITFISFIFPIKMDCPGGTCTIAPDASGNLGSYYEVVPMVVPFLEDLTGKDIGFYYSSGFDSMSE